ncbi:hypothetical protein PT047_08860, partial [Erysipelothrix rhusiopathiae]|nr:hypothetical protein [Erysipelothrix rhusiopathiae]
FATQQVMDKPTAPSLTLEQIAKGLEVCIATAVTVKEDHKIQGPHANYQNLNDDLGLAVYEEVIEKEVSPKTYTNHTQIFWAS